MQGIYTYIPETNYVPREYSVAAILLLLFIVLISLVPVLNLLYFYISTLRSMCAVPNMAVFWSSLTSCFPSMYVCMSVCMYVCMYYCCYYYHLLLLLPTESHRSRANFSVVTTARVLGAHTARCTILRVICLCTLSSICLMEHCRGAR
jgi:hypothetical protein